MARASAVPRWIAMDGPRRFRTPGTTLLGRYRGDYVQAFAVYFHKDVIVSPRARRMRIEACGLGLFEIRIDGRKIGDRVLDPPPTDYRKRALMSVFEIAAPPAGRRRIIAAVGNGRHLPAFGGGDPKLWCRVWVDEGEGDRVAAVSDGTWRAGHGPVRENGLFFGEVRDARVGLRPERWKPAVIVTGPRLETEAMPPARVSQRLRPRAVRRPEPGRRIIDFGRNFAGWLRLGIRGPAGARIAVRHAELLDEDGGLNVSPNQGAAATDIFILAGRGRETCEPIFTQHGFRYAELTGPEAALRGAEIEGRVVHTDLRRTGRFDAADPVVRAVHANIRRGLLSNLIGIPTDCPQRDERQGWLADAHLAAEAAILSFDMAAFYRKFLRDIREAQDRRGRIPDYVPAYLARLAPADPAWGSAYPTLAWLLYWYYGDKETLREHFEGLARYVGFLESRAEGHILETLGKYGDWCPPGSIAPKKASLALTSTWFYLHDVKTMARIAAAIGRKAEAAGYGRQAEAVAAAFNRRFLKDGQYEVPRSSPIEKFAGQTSNALPLWLGIVPPAERKRVFAALVKAVAEDQDYHLDTGILGTRFLLEALSLGGRTDAAFRVVRQTSYPGWGYMVKEGATTLWERWEKVTGGGMNSHNHVMLASVDAWFYKFLAGVRCAAPGWTKAVIEPPLVDGCRTARASVEAAGGTLSARWERDEDGLTLDVRVPDGVKAEVRLPLLSPHSRIEDDTGPVRDGRLRSGRLIVNLSASARSFRIRK